MAETLEHKMAELAEKEQFLQQLAGLHGRQRLRAERLALGLPSRNVVSLQNPVRDAAERKQLQRAANVASHVAELQAASQDQIKSRSRHHAQLPSPGDRPGQAPGRYPDTHAALNDRRQFFFHMHLRMHLARRLANSAVRREHASQRQADKQRDHDTGIAG